MNTKSLLSFLILGLLISLGSCNQTSTESDQNEMQVEIEEQEASEEIEPNKEDAVEEAEEVLPNKEKMLLGKRVFGSHFFDNYGTANFEIVEGKIILNAGQTDENKNYCTLQGTVNIIDDRNFTVEGMLEMFFYDGFCEDEVVLNQNFNFRRSGNRKYWRMQMPQTPTGFFQKCYHYIDIYM